MKLDWIDYTLLLLVFAGLVVLPITLALSDGKVTEERRVICEGKGGVLVQTGRRGYLCFDKDLYIDLK